MIREEGLYRFLFATVRYWRVAKKWDVVARIYYYGHDRTWFCSNLLFGLFRRVSLLFATLCNCSRQRQKWRGSAETRNQNCGTCPALINHIRIRIRMRLLWLLTNTLKDYKKFTISTGEKSQAHNTIIGTNRDTHILT